MRVLHLHRKCRSTCTAHVSKALRIGTRELRDAQLTGEVARDVNLVRAYRGIMAAVAGIAVSEVVSPGVIAPAVQKRMLRDAVSTLPGVVATRHSAALTVDISYKDDIYFTEFNRLLEGQDSYTIYDAQLRYASDDGRWIAELWGKNLSDEDVASSTFQLATARVIGVTYMPPRMYGLTVGYQF